MPDATYDAVIVGGGHNGLSVALYLANSGVTVAVFERNNEVGGGCMTLEIAAPGFWSNVHSHGHMHWMGSDNFPAYADFDLEKKYGVRYCSTVGRGGIVFPDETCLVWYMPDEPEGAEKVYREMSKFSERDAEQLMRLAAPFYGPQRDLLLKYFYSPPLPLGQDSALLQEFAEAMGIGEADFHYYMAMSPLQLLDELFESGEIKCWFAEVMRSSSVVIDACGMGFMGLLTSLIIDGSHGIICEGGSHNLAHAMQRAFHDLGGKSYTQSEVDSIVVENSRATGVRLVDGTQIEARKVVVSAVDTTQTMLRLVGHGYDTIIWPQIAFHERPLYNAASSNPDAAELESAFMGPLSHSLEDYRRANLECALGRFPEGWMPMLAWVNSFADPTRAPKGLVEGGGQGWAPKASALSEREWLEVKRTMPQRFMKLWEQYASNMTWDNVIGFNCHTPWDVANRNINAVEGGMVFCNLVPSQIYRFRPIPELSGFRTPIKGLYMCANCMPTVPTGVNGAPGYCCYKVLAEDYGLEKIWEKKGRAY
jgi:phytoene dehydrogenase-like protein